MLRLDRGLRYEQQGKSAGQGGHAIHKVDGYGKSRLTATVGAKIKIKKRWLGDSTKE